jgi:ribosome-associated protein
MQNEDADLEYISKTQLKAEAEAQQMLGKKLLNLTKGQVIKLNLDENLYDAIVEAKRLTSNGAIKRQLQYIGRLMRTADIEPIKKMLAGWEGKNNAENARFHALERWRDRLIDEAATSQSDTLQEFVTKHTHADIQKLRTLIRNANKEKAENKTLKSSRDLFKLIREITESQENINENDSD